MLGELRNLKEKRFIRIEKKGEEIEEKIIMKEEMIGIEDRK